MSTFLASTLHLSEASRTLAVLMARDQDEDLFGKVRKRTDYEAYRIRRIRSL